MQRLIISSKYSEDFVYRYLPALLKQYIKEQILRNQKSDAIKYINKHYAISLEELLCFIDYIRVSKFKNIYILDYDVNVKHKSKIPVRSILHILTYGNIEVKGLHIIDRAIEFVANNLNHIYRGYTFNIPVRSS